MPKIRGVKPDFWTNEEIVELSIPARLLFIGLWNLACDNGHLPDKPKQIKMRLLPTDSVDVDELLDEIASQERITRAEGTITIVNFAKHQKPHRRWWTTCDLPGCEVPEDAPQQGANGGKAGSKEKSQPLENGVTPGAHGGSTADVDCEGDVDGEVEGDGDGETTRELTLHEAPRPEVERLCEHLASRIEANGSKRPTITKGWRDAARLMLDRDGRNEPDVHTAIDWCQNDEFWRTNILSMPKLREQYDRLRLAATRGAAPRRGEIDWDAAFDRAAAKTAGGSQ